MQSIKISSWGLSLIVMVFWLDVNDAIPFGPYTDGKPSPSPSRQSKDWNSTKRTVTITGQPESFSEAPKLSTNLPIELSDVQGSNNNLKSNLKFMETHPSTMRSESKHQKSHTKESVENNISDNNDSLSDNSVESKSIDKSYNESDVEPDVKKHLENMEKKKDMPEKCPNDECSKKPAYTRSFPLNSSSIDFADAFKIAGDAEAKKTSSVHIGEDITICWIETTTIKEDPKFDPPKRLVIREFTISFENSATIPENYLECTKLDGEIAAGDEETTGKTSLHEVIDENTKRSRVMNFTCNSQNGPINVYQQKTVRCAVGGVVFKDIYEWPDGSDNPKKRVEIKVGPSIRNFGVRSETESGECTIDAVARNSDKEQNTASPCKDENCFTSSLSGETLLTTDLPETNRLSTNKEPKITTTKKPEEPSTPKNLLSLSPNKTDQTGSDSCPEYDKDCQLGKTTAEPDDNEIGICSGEDCTGGSSDVSASEASGDQSEDTSVPCIGDECTSKEESVTAGPDEITRENSESINSTEKSATLPTENKIIDKIILPSVNGTEKMTLNDPGCDSESGECLDSLETSSSEEKQTSATTSGIINSENNSTKTEQATTPKNVDVESTTERLGETELPSKTSSHEEEQKNVTKSGRNDSKIEEHTTKHEKETTPNYTDFESTTGHHGTSKLPSESSSRDEGKTSAATSGRNDSEIGEYTTKYEKQATSKNSDLETTTNRHGETELSDGIGSADVRGFSGAFSTTATLSPCHDSADCTTLIPAGLGFSNELATTGVEEYSTVTEKMEHSVTTKEDPSISGTESSDNEQSVSCSEDSTNEKCQSMEYSSESESEDDNSTTYLSPEVLDSKQTTLSVSGKQDKNTNQVDDDSVTKIPILSTDLQTPRIEASTELPGSIANVTSGKNSVTECPISGEGAGDCGVKQTDMPSLNSEDTTVSSESCESSGTCDSIDEISSSTEKNQSLSINSTTPNENLEKISCDQSKESCETSSSGASSEICEDGSSNENCTSNASIAESCDSSTGSCSSEGESSTRLIDETIIMTTEPTTNELQHFSTTIDNVSTTAETRRSTASTASLTSAPTKGHHKLALRIKVLLEHINENKEKEKLVQVEKHLLLNENPAEHGNHSLVWQIKSLNNSINMETFKSIFNCTILGNLTEEFSNLTEFKNKNDKGITLRKKVEDPFVEKSTTEVANETLVNLMDASKENSSRKKREISFSEGNGENREKNITDLTKVKAIRESLPGVNEDFQKGLDHVLSRISEELVGPATTTVTKPVESSSSTVLKILADPTDGRVHSRRRKRAASKVGGEGVVSIEELENPVNGEEIDRWSNERFVSAADGGRVRSVLEFKIMRNPGESSLRIPSGS